MTSWMKDEIETSGGAKALAQMPVIVSASRSTDIPAFYSDWFMERLKDKGQRLACSNIMSKDIASTTPVRTSATTATPTPTTPQRWRTGTGTAPVQKVAA